jgi:hypothetical protein
MGRRRSFEKGSHVTNLAESVCQIVNFPRDGVEAGDTT